jgi:hypothetical protein
MIWGQENFGIVSNPNAGKPSMKQPKNSVWTCKIMYAMSLQVIAMLMGFFGQAAVGLCERAHHTGSACCRTTVGAKLNVVLATRQTPNYVSNQFA